MISNDLLAGWNVAVIDDEPDSLYVAQYILEYYHAIVHTAVNGEEGYTLVRNIKPNFVISDLSMPKVNGWGLIEKLKKDVSTRDIPVIALTAHSMVGDREKALAAGFHNYLSKPLTVETFIKDLLKLLIDVPEFHDKLKDIEF